MQHTIRQINVTRLPATPTYETNQSQLDRYQCDLSRRRRVFGDRSPDHRRAGKAIHAVNTALRRVVERLAEFIARRYPGLRGFTRPNSFRMRQFYEAYRNQEKVSPPVRQSPWTHNLTILGQTNLLKEREFYLQFAVQEKMEQARTGNGRSSQLFSSVLCGRRQKSRHR